MNIRRQMIISNYTGDVNSVMHGGELVKERHYAPFAGWLTEKFSVAAHLSRSEIDYKVNGTTLIWQMPDCRIIIQAI